MIRVRRREKIGPIHMMPGDSISVDHTDMIGRRHTLIRETIGRTIVADEVVLFDVADELGFEDGVGGAIGKAAPGVKPHERSGFVEGKNFLGEPIGEDFDSGLEVVDSQPGADMPYDQSQDG